MPNCTFTPLSLFMHLILDVGNTRIKWALFRQRELVYQFDCSPEEFRSLLKKTRKQYPQVERILVAATGELDQKQVKALKDWKKPHWLSHQSNLPFTNQYQTPETLGLDRMGLMAAAALHHPEKNVLVIDAGTCVTYDLLSSDNTYKGGIISPGLYMRYRSMHRFTAKLPLLEPEVHDQSIGGSTSASMHLGAVGGILMEIDGFINDYRAQVDDLTVILTGGDAEFLRDNLKNDIFAHSNFLLEGLNYILEINPD